MQCFLIKAKAFLQLFKTKKRQWLYFNLFLTKQKITFKSLF